jgi:hypothetical protein
MVKKGDCSILIKRLVLILSLFLMISQASGDIPPHIDPGNVTQSDSNLKERQALIINELLSHWSGLFISLDKGDIKSARDNFGQYLDILQQNNNILIEIEGDAYQELKESGNTFNLTMDEVEKLRALYEEGKIAYQNNQTQKAIQIALESRGIIGNLNSYHKKFIMDAVEQFPGINITDYQVGSSKYDNVLRNLRNRWRLVELTLFDDSSTSLTVHPKEAESGQVIYIDGAVTMPGNRKGVQNATVVIRINGTTDTTVLTNKNGNYNYTYTIPYKKPGKYTVNAEFVPIEEPLLSSYASSYFVIIPTNTALTTESQPDSGIFGDIITISGTLLTKNRSVVSDADISISLDNRTISSVKTDNNGSYTYNLHIQGIPAGVHTLKADFIPDDQPLFSSRNTTSIKLMASNTSLTILAEPESAQFNDVMQISGNLVAEPDLILSGVKIAITLDDKILDSIYTDDDGKYQYILKVPIIHEGTHSIKAEYLPDDELLIRSRNNSTITVIPTNTSIKIFGPGTVYLENYLNISWSVTTEKGFVLKDTGITVFLDDREIGSAIINSGDFYFSYWINRNAQKGEHNLTVKYAGTSPFLPSERTNIIEILEPEFNYNILYILGVIGIMICAFYMRKDTTLHNKIDSLTSFIRSRIEPAIKPETIPETFDKEENIEESIKMEEPGPVENVVQEKEKVQENEKKGKAFPEIEELIAQSKYHKSISLSHFTIKNMISEHLKIDQYQCLTHRELFDRVKGAIHAIHDEMKDMTEIYEFAMYSGIDASKEQAVRALELVKNISNKLNNEL